MDKELLERLQTALKNPDNHPTLNEMLTFEASVERVLRDALRDKSIITVSREGSEAVIHIRSSNPELLRSLETLGYRNMKGVYPDGA